VHADYSREVTVTASYFANPFTSTNYLKIVATSTKTVTTQLKRKAQIRGREDPHQVIKQAKEIVAQLHIKADLRIQCFLQFLYLCNLLYYAILAFAILSRALVLAPVHLLRALCSSTPWGAGTCRTPKAESRGTLPKLYTPSRFGVSNGAWLSLEAIQDCWS